MVWLSLLGILNSGLGHLYSAEDCLMLRNSNRFYLGFQQFVAQNRGDFLTRC